MSALSLFGLLYPTASVQVLSMKKAGFTELAFLDLMTFSSIQLLTCRLNRLDYSPTLILSIIGFLFSNFKDKCHVLHKYK